jgi:flavin-dependent dehydrogenase
MALESSCIGAAELAGVRLMRGITVQGLRREGGHWHVQTSCGPLTCHWIVDATGRSAAVARRLGVRQVAMDRLVSVHTRTSNSNGTDLDNRVLIEATEHGWWYSALTPCGRRTFAFQTDVDFLRGADWQSANWFSNGLQGTRCVGPALRSHGYRLDALPALESARTCRLDSFSGPGWMAAGDAAFAVDPLSGQGMLRAIEGAKAAAQALLAGPQGLRMRSEELESDWHAYLREWTSNYAMERRWPDAPFWSRRRISSTFTHGRPPARASSLVPPAAAANDRTAARML